MWTALPSSNLIDLMAVRSRVYVEGSVEVNGLDDQIRTPTTGQGLPRPQCPSQSRFSSLAVSDIDHSSTYARKPQGEDFDIASVVFRSCGSFGTNGRSPAYRRKSKLRVVITGTLSSGCDSSESEVL